MIKVVLLLAWEKGGETLSLKEINALLAGRKGEGGKQRVLPVPAS